MIYRRARRHSSVTGSCHYACCWMLIFPVFRTASKENTSNVEERDSMCLGSEIEKIIFPFRHTQQSIKKRETISQRTKLFITWTTKKKEAVTTSWDSLSSVSPPSQHIIQQQQGAMCKSGTGIDLWWASASSLKIPNNWRKKQLYEAWNEVCIHYVSDVVSRHNLTWAAESERWRRRKNIALKWYTTSAQRLVSDAIFQYFFPSRCLLASLADEERLFRFWDCWIWCTRVMFSRALDIWRVREMLLILIKTFDKP